MSELPTDKNAQGRAGLVAFRKYRSGVRGARALGKAFYKGGFEPKMNRREASLILQLKYAHIHHGKYVGGELTSWWTVSECLQKKKYERIIDSLCC